MIKKIAITAGLFVLVFALLVGATFGVKFYKFQKKYKAMVVENVAFTQVKDGEYEGFYDLYLVNAKIMASVHNGKLNDIRIVEHKHGPGYSGEAICNRVIEKQRLDVDAVSGSTASCKTILKAVEIALKKGLQ